MRISDWSSDVCSSDLQDRRTDRRLTIDILVREARRGNSQGRKPVAVQLRHLLPAPPLAVLDPRFPRTVDHQLRDILRFQKREERREIVAQAGGIAQDLQTQFQMVDYGKVDILGEETENLK